MTDRSNSPKRHIYLVPPAPPLPSSMRQPNRSPSITPSESVSSTPTQSTYKPPTRIIRTPPPTTIFQPKPLRPSTLSDRSTPVRPTAGRTTLDSKAKTTGTSGTLSRVSARDVGKGKYPTISKLVPVPLDRGPKSDQSIFEKVDIRNRRTSYLGSGSFNQLEDCIKDCLARDRRRPEKYHSSTNYHSPMRSLTRASVLEDYSYDGIITSNHHAHRSSDRYHHSDHHHHHQHGHDHSRSAANLSLTEIRRVNDALAKYGIAVFSHEDHYNNRYRRNHTVGEILSACQLLAEDPTLAAYKNGPPAVHNVWDHLQHSQPPSYSGNYGSSAVQGVASHLFNSNNQNSYNPAQNPPSNLYNPPPPNQPPNNAGRNVLANLFSGQPQQSSYPPPPPPPPMNPPPSNAGRSVLASLFSGQPQQSSAAPSYGSPPQQYPNNNNYRPYW